MLFVAGNTVAQQDTVFVRHPKNWQSGEQTYSTDTIITDHLRDKLLIAGTSIIPNTNNQWKVASETNLMLDGVSQPDCISDRAMYSDVDRIRFIQETDSSFTIATTIHENCCYNFLCDVTVNENGILNLTYIGFGWSICGCMCSFNLDYRFVKDPEFDRSKIKGIMINNNPKSLKVL